MLAAHLVPPQLLGVVSQSANVFGDMQKAEQVFYEAEVIPLQKRFRPINDRISQKLVQFRKRALRAR